MDGIMYTSVDQVTEQETREEHIGDVLHQQVHHTKDQRGQENAGNRWHKQPLPVPRVFMVITMDRIGQFLQPWVFADHMENETVHYVLKKGPE